MGTSDECSHQEGNEVRGQLDITSFPPVPRSVAVLQVREQNLGMIGYPLYTPF